MVSLDTLDTSGLPCQEGFLTEGYPGIPVEWPQPREENSVDQP